ncbi:MAG: hypothetical protein ABIO24_08720 [Saprospiraceae bacterium]
MRIRPVCPETIQRSGKKGFAVEVLQQRPADYRIGRGVRSEEDERIALIINRLDPKVTNGFEEDWVIGGGDVQV